MINHYASPADAMEAERLLPQKFRDPHQCFDIAWWTTSQSLVAPRSLNRTPGIGSATALSADTGWPVVFRQTGGDITPQGAGVLNVVVAFAMDPDEQASINAVYDMFCAPILHWLKKNGCDANTGFVPGSFCDGQYNIVVNGLKVAGTAQRWTRVRAGESRQIVFAHALLLLEANLQAGTDAINSLYQQCRIDRHIRHDTHANIGDVLVNPDSDWKQTLVHHLHLAYAQELTALTS